MRFSKSILKTDETWGLTCPAKDVRAVFVMKKTKYHASKRLHQMIGLERLHRLLIPHVLQHCDTDCWCCWLHYCWRVHWVRYFVLLATTKLESDTYDDTLATTNVLVAAYYSKTPSLLDVCTSIFWPSSFSDITGRLVWLTCVHWRSHL